MRTTVALAAVAVLGAVGVGAAFLYQRDDGQDRAATSAVEQFAQGWTDRDLSGVPFADPEAAGSFTPAVEGLSASAVTVEAADVDRDGSTATADLTVTWTLPGNLEWTYTAPVRAEAGPDGAWQIGEPEQGSYWHPDMNPGDAMTATRVAADRGDLLDRNGASLMPLGTVYPVQLDPTRATAEVAAALEKVVEAEPGSLVAELAAATEAGSQAPIPVITYREDDFAARRDALDALQGVLYPRTVQPLATDRQFGQPLLGSYGEVTAEIAEASQGRYTSGDRAGLSGLQLTYDTRLAGTPKTTVTTTSDSILFERDPVAGEDVTLTLDPDVQRAAESALTATGDVPSALVAIDVATGQVLAAANRPWFGFDRANTGRYPPGSTFKIASTYALLTQKKVELTERVSCPPTVTVDGREFRNFEGETLGSPTFADDVTHSCNTAFVQLADRLEPGDLADAAEALGLGAGWAATFGVPEAFGGSIPQTTGATDQASAMIGQGRNLVSPLALATMTSSVARGAYLPPALVTDPAPQDAPERTPVTLGEAEIADLRTVLRSVVTEGTATALAATPGGPVSGKTGTAEFGSDSPPKTHAWFTGWQADVAVAVLVEDGRSGGSVAAPIAKAFLTSLAAD